MKGCVVGRRVRVVVFVCVLVLVCVGVGVFVWDKHDVALKCAGVAGRYESVKAEYSRTVARLATARKRFDSDVYLKDDGEYKKFVARVAHIPVLVDLPSCKTRADVASISARLAKAGDTVKSVTATVNTFQHNSEKRAAELKATAEKKAREEAARKEAEKKATQTRSTTTGNTGSTYSNGRGRNHTNSNTHSNTSASGGNESVPDLNVAKHSDVPGGGYCTPGTTLHTNYGTATC